MPAPRLRFTATSCLIASLLASPLLAAPPTPLTSRGNPVSPWKVVPLPKAVPQITLPQGQGVPPRRTLPQVALPQRTLPKVTLPGQPGNGRPPALPPLTNAGRGQAVGGNGNAIQQIPGSLRQLPRTLGDEAREALERRERLGDLSGALRPQDGDWIGPLPWDWDQADPDAPGNPDPEDPGPGVNAGPTAWDWVAIGLSAAALARANESASGSAVYPIVCPAPVVVDRVVEDAEPPLAAVHETASASVGTPNTTADLPRLEAGKSFALPGTGLGATAGRAAIKIGPVFVECRIDAWTDTGLEATVPAVVLAEAAAAEMIIAKADSTPIARLKFVLLPAARPHGDTPPQE